VVTGVPDVIPHLTTGRIATLTSGRTENTVHESAIAFRDRLGRVWEYAVYESPSGPAFWLKIPDELMGDHVANYTVHFDGVMGVVQPHLADR